MPEERLHNPHDRFFKRVFGRVQAAAAFFREYLPPEIAREIDWGHLKRVEGSFVDETLRERHADLLFTAPWKGQEVFLYLLFEHQSTEDPWMPLRLLRYMVRIWEDQIRQDPQGRRLAPILPIVLHQSTEGWKPIQNFSSLLQWPTGSAELLAPYTPKFEHYLIDLADWPMERLRGSIVVKSILATMKASQSGDFLERLDELAPLLSGALRETDLELVRICLEYLMRGSKEVDMADFRSKLDQLSLPEIKEDIMSLADQLIQEGRQQGVQEGRQQGVQEGEAVLLKRLLARRFGDLPQWALERLDQASSADLERWSERILEADRLEEVFPD